MHPAGNEHGLVLCIVDRLTAKIPLRFVTKVAFGRIRDVLRQHPIGAVRLILLIIVKHDNRTRVPGIRKIVRKHINRLAAAVQKGGILGTDGLGSVQDNPTVGIGFQIEVPTAQIQDFGIGENVERELCSNLVI